MTAGFDPDSFWHQTPRGYSLAMKGVRKRRETEREEQVALAWQVAAFTASAHSKSGLKPLEHYLQRLRPQTGQEMLAVLKALGAGSDMKIERLDGEG